MPHPAYALSMQLGTGQHTRPRVSRPAPSPVGIRRTLDGVGEGADHGTRGRVRSPSQLHRHDEAVDSKARPPSRGTKLRMRQ